MIEHEDGWKAFRIQGILDFSLIGILSKLSTLLAENCIGVFAISTFNTDYILTKKDNYEKAINVLSSAGYKIVWYGICLFPAVTLPGMTAFPCPGSCAERGQVSGGGFRFQHFHHLVGGGVGWVLLEKNGNHKDSVTYPRSGHAIRAAGCPVFLLGVGHR